MADVNVNAHADQAPTMAPPTRTDDQILPHIRRFWDTVRYDKTAGCYKCQLDEQWFNLTKNTLRDAIQITPVDNNNAFSSPLTPDTLINFVNDMGYPKVVKNLSNFVTNDMFQPWRALTTIINLCLTGKTSGFDRPRAPVLQILWGIVNRAHIGYSKQKFHLRPDSPLHLPNEEPILGYINSLRSIDESVDEGIPEKEPRFDDEEADVQRALEESLKNVYDAPRGPLPPMVISEPDSGKYQPLLETPKKKSPAEQFIFQRHTSTPTESSGHDVSSSLYAELGLTDSEVESDEDVPGIDAGVQDKGQTRPNLGEQDEGQAGPNPGDAATSQPQSSPVVHAGPNLEHTDLEATDVSTQPHTKQMDEGFTATAYLNVHENLKLTVEEQVILEEPASSTGTLSSLQHLPKDLNFGDLFFNDKPSEANNEKTNAETKAESMMSVTIQQDTSAIPPMTTPIIDLTSRPDSLNAGQSHGSAAPSSSKTVSSAEYKAWTITDTRLRTSVSSTPEDLHMDDDMAPDAQVHSSDDEVIGNAHIPEVNLRQDWWKPLKEDRPATPEPAWSIPSSDLPTGPVKDKESLNLNHKTWKALHLNLLKSSILIKPLPLGGPPGQVKIQSDFFFNKDLKYLRYGSKGSKPALSISKMKANYYPDVGLEQMVPDQMWIEEECKFDIAAMYGHLNHLPPKDKKILTTAINLCTRDLVIRQRVEDFQLGIESYQTQLNLTKPRWDATGFEYKHNYKVIDSPRAVTFQDKYGVQMIMRFNEIHKFNDDTLHQIDEAFDYRVKEFMVNRMNPGLNTRFWTRKDVDRSKEFMFAIQKRLKTSWIFRNLESFVGGRVRDGDYRLLKRTE
uniref:Monodehydroascorbate reductase n=1 Tax=Tanacetum cinerariifolium TaxID=118510 RepID=A0A6L2KJU3_TANCI|nr:hypothetical protein [Tanacetum cinerariifolium]